MKNPRLVRGFFLTLSEHPGNLRIIPKTPASAALSELFKPEDRANASVLNRDLKSQPANLEKRGANWTVRNQENAARQHLFAAATICHLKSHSSDPMLHIRNKKMAKRDKTTYWGTSEVFWRYSFAVWWQCIRLFAVVLPIRQKCWNQLDKATKRNAMEQRVKALCEDNRVGPDFSLNLIQLGDIHE